ncbi:MAG: hypothetical protein IT158_00345 [Bryobacterales bacterium]|nr:hypothetical protein [Bryobacterales bacterium]
MADRSIESQLLWGFHQVEMNQWRWTARDFAVALRPPTHAEEAGARLLVRLFFPPSHIAELGAITLEAEVEGCPTGPERYAEAGMHTYVRDLGAGAMATNILPVAFTLDKALPPSPTEPRELGSVVTLIELNSK